METYTHTHTHTYIYILDIHIYMASDKKKLYIAGNANI